MPDNNRYRKLRIHYLALAMALVLALALPLSIAAQELNGVIVSVGSADLDAGQTADIPVQVMGFYESGGLGGYDLEVSYTPGVIEVIGVLGGDAPFDTVTAYAIDNVAGSVSFVAVHGEIPGPTGDFTIAYLRVTATGTPGASTGLTLTKYELAEAFDGVLVPATPEDGEVTIAEVEDIPPVGGTAHPVNRLTLLAPWIALAAIMAGMSLLIYSRRGTQSQA